MNMMHNLTTFREERSTTGLTSELNRISTLVTVLKNSLVELPNWETKQYLSPLIQEAEKAVERARGYTSEIAETFDRI